MTQPLLAARCNLLAWNLSRETLAKDEPRFRRVSDCELLYPAKALNTSIESLLPSRDEAGRVIKSFFRDLEQR